jgi:dTDP-4-dehydrorhamnose 3,5-epimerase
MKVIQTKIPDFLILEPRVFGDDRGFFLESWNEKNFAELGVTEKFVQDNHSYSHKGVLRGLHYQLRHPQGKLVWVVEGEVLDVVVDLRRSSPTFGQWTSVRLSGENKLRAWVPKGFAHGFHVLSETAHFCYKCTDYYRPDDDRCIRWDDPDLQIDWLQFPDQNPLLSQKDLAGSSFSDAEYFL